MFQQGRVIIVWLSWLVGGVCGVVILLIIICYCRLMPRHQKSFDEQYLKENYTIKENHAYSAHDSCRVKHAEVQAQVQRHARPVSYAGAPPPPLPRPAHAAHPAPVVQYASSSMLDELEAGGGGGAAGGGAAGGEAAAAGGGAEALKTRSLPALLRPRARPQSAEAELQQLYSKAHLSKKYKNRMRSEHAAIIALSKSRSQFLDADAVIVYDQRTQL